MFKINRKIEYALISLKHMSAKTTGLTSAKEICDIYQVPFDPTSRVLQIMAQHGILQAEQGAKGGYRITRPLNLVSLKELSELIIGPIEITNCFHGEISNCEISCNCQIISPMLNLNDRITGLFKEVSVSDLLDSKHTRESTIRSKRIFESVIR